MYIHEVGNEKVITIGVAFYWFLLVLTGLGTRPLIESKVLGPFTFIIFAILNTSCTVFVCLYMKETKGLSEIELKRLYSREEKLAIILSTKTEVVMKSFCSDAFKSE